MAVFVFPPVDKEKKNKYARENLQPLQSLPTRYFQAHRVAGPRTHRKTGYTWHGTQLDRLSLARNAAGPAILGTERSWSSYTWHGMQLGGTERSLARNAAGQERKGGCNASPQQVMSPSSKPSSKQQRGHWVVHASFLDEPFLLLCTLRRRRHVELHGTVRLACC